MLRAMAFVLLPLLGATVCRAAEPVTLDNTCQPRGWPGTVPLTDADKTVQQRYAVSCPKLFHIAGLDFGDGKKAYLCPSWLGRVRGSEDEARQEAVRTQFKAEFTAENERKGRSLAYVPLMGGSYFVIVIVTDASGNSVWQITSREAMAAHMPTITTPEAAATFATLDNKAGRMASPTAFCEAKAFSTDEGWRFEDVRVAYDCGPVERQTIAVSRSGTAEVQSRKLTNEPAPCVD